MDKKITVVGAGFVGTACAKRIIEKNLADVTLMDIVEGLPQGKALDLMQSAAIEGFSKKIRGTNDYKDTQNSDIVIITAGSARKPGMSRDDLFKINSGIISDVVARISEFSRQSIIIMVTNPLDAMTYLAFKTSGFPPHRVLGMAGILDSARYSYFISEKLGCMPSEVSSTVLGGHGDTMVPMPRLSKIKGKPLTKLLSADEINGINERTQNGGAEIVKLLKTGSAYYAPSSSAVKMAEHILKDINEIIPCSVYLNGEYGLRDIYFGVPVRLC
ncbi:MAG: malate dehydrogenase, partial [Candidatus Aureabacteria bacterium]|nr:malate dehydrogenase [Candidatus Auribacterota bacterium]